MKIIEVFYCDLKEIIVVFVVVFLFECGVIGVSIDLKTFVFDDGDYYFYGWIVGMDSEVVEN